MADRLSIEVEELPIHSQPFPIATRKGGMIFSSAISGYDRETKSWPDDPAAQIANAFDNLKTVVEAASATVEDVCKVVCFLADRDQRPLVNAEWVKMFPDETSRPVRHTIAGPSDASFEPDAPSAWFLIARSMSLPPIFPRGK